MGLAVTLSSVLVLSGALHLIAALLGRSNTAKKDTSRDVDESDKFTLDALKPIHGKRFVNETVPLDGYSYSDCEFENVTMEYNGSAAFGFVHNNLKGSFQLKAGAPCVEYSWIALKGFGYTKENIPMFGPDKKTPVKHLESPRGELEIVSAKYGLDDKWEEAKDVTEKVRSKMINGRLNLNQSYNSLFGPDPYRHLRKKLRVDYIENGIELTRIVPENYRLQL